MENKESLAANQGTTSQDLTLSTEHEQFLNYRSQRQFCLWSSQRCFKWFGSKGLFVLTKDSVEAIIYAYFMLLISYLQ